ncbi:hypothetical protein CIHG_02801 [Coccidioides immitis H538.4]|uniref:DUF7820 domain-containing protein n=1 Tax=Coccidioides immitis H538.4 TaxID=396776 RepID=A0A0J8UCN0_COCIT|nr:hypothetical protein CIHG_02801 [Coccidioides immitis H538.4]TPX19634.1 hypothetical protein DIZ76_017426 [Coccidioides immitis]
MAQPPSSRLPSDQRDESRRNTHTTQIRSLSSGLESSSEGSPIQNVFSDEFSLEPLDQFSSNRSSLTTRTLTDNSPPSPLSLDGARPSSMVSPFDDSSDSSRIVMQTPREPPIISDQGRHVLVETSPAARAASVSSETTSNQSSTRRSLSPSSRFSMPRAMSPYRGQTRPSHPYAMYPQGIGVARSSSTSTVSTVRPPERNFVAAAPQHPYAMYSQNTVPEEADGAQNPPIPIGFPRQTQPYQVPSTQAPNEVGDIVGPDGHMEQLPPYSRYPESLPAKRELASDEDVSTDTAPTTDETAVSPRPAGSSDAGEDRQDANLSLNDTSGGFKEKLTKKGRKKVCCGVPLWMFFLVAAVLLLGTVIGGVIGGLLGSQQGAKRDPPASSTPTATVTVTAGTLDAIPLPTGDPGSLLPLPTGQFNIPAGTLQDNSSNCVTASEYERSWQCRAIGMFNYEIQKDEDENAMIVFTSYNVSGHFYYGAQPPIFRDPDHPLELMLDKTNVSLGPAYFFFTAFDKLVIIPDEAFPRPIPKRGVDGSRLLQRWPRLFERVSSSPGDKPWFCWWNNTLIEVFIYANEMSSATEAANSPSPSPSGTATSDAYEPEQTIGERGGVRLPQTPQNFSPRVIKIEEKRYKSHGQTAYCEQMQVLDNGNVNRLSPEQIPIDEIYTYTDAGLASDSERGLFKRGKFHDVGCFCQYFYD